MFLAITADRVYHALRLSPLRVYSHLGQLFRTVLKPECPNFPVPHWPKLTLA